MVAQFSEIDIVLLVQQLVEGYRQLDALAVEGPNLLVLLEDVLQTFVGDAQQGLELAETALLEPLHGGMHPIDIRARGCDFTVQIGRKKGAQGLAIAGLPEVQDRLHEIGDPITALHMALFAQKMQVCAENAAKYPCGG